MSDLVEILLQAKFTRKRGFVSLAWWEPGEKKVKGIQKKGKCGGKQRTRSVDKAIGVRRQETTRTPTLG